MGGNGSNPNSQNSGNTFPSFQDEPIKDLVYLTASFTDKVELFEKKGEDQTYKPFEISQNEIQQNSSTYVMNRGCVFYENELIVGELHNQKISISKNPAILTYMSDCT